MRTDIVEVYVVRPLEASHRPDIDAPSIARGSRFVRYGFLQLLRAREPLKDTWHPVMGHAEPGETSLRLASRELLEETGLDLARAGSPEHPALALWALQTVTPFYVGAIDQIVLAVRFCCLVSSHWRPALNNEHSQHRWVPDDDLDRHTLWPSQLDACREIRRAILPARSASADRLRIDLPLRADDKDA